MPGAPDLTHGQWRLLAAGAAVVFAWCAYRLNRRDNCARVVAVVTQLLVYGVPMFMFDAVAPNDSGASGANGCGLIFTIVVVYQLSHVSTRRWCRGEDVKDSLA